MISHPFISFLYIQRVDSISNIENIEVISKFAYIILIKFHVSGFIILMKKSKLSNFILRFMNSPFNLRKGLTYNIWIFHYWKKKLYSKDM